MFIDPPRPESGIQFELPIEQRANPGLHGRLRIEARPWNQQDESAP